MFQPVIPDVGLAGWRFLQRTYDSQFEAFSKSVEVQRDSTYFRENIAAIQSAEDLVADRRLLTVALGAFGLQDDIDNRFFIRKVLEDGTTSRDALSVRMADTRYKELSQAFGFGPSETRQTAEPGFADRIVDGFEANAFEVAAGQQNDAMRIALYAQRELPGLVEQTSSTDTKWFTIMGDPPMRQVFEKALGLPAAIGQIDIDQQLDVFKERARRVFGSDDLSQLADPEEREQLITRFLVRDQLDSLGNGMSANAIALSLLR